MSILSNIIMKITYIKGCIWCYLFYSFYNNLGKSKAKFT